MNSKEVLTKYCADLDQEVLNKKVHLENVKGLKQYIKQLVIPILNCIFLENKYLIFKDNSIFKIEVK